MEPARDAADPTGLEPNDLVFTPAVRAQQARLGSRESYARFEAKRGFARDLSEDLARFVAERDSFLLATASADGQPYVQHRGGPKGFLRVVGPRTLAFADYRGNRQYISIGNLSENPRAFLFLIDYANAARVKLWGTAEFVEDDAELLASLTDPAYGEVPERAIRFHVEAWDENCHKHIPRLVPAETHETGLLRARVAELEREVAALRAAAG